jgi:hypothetical protein
VQFSNLLSLDEPLNIGGFIREWSPGGVKRRIHLDIIGEKVGRTPTIAGTASALPSVSR